MISFIAIGAGFGLILIGLYGALTNRNMLRMIVAFTVANTGVNLVLVAVGHMFGRTAPILDSVVPVTEAASRIIDPVPQALVLTAIVIGFGGYLVLAFDPPLVSIGVIVSLRVLTQSRKFC